MSAPSPSSSSTSASSTTVMTKQSSALILRSRSAGISLATFFIYLALARLQIPEALQEKHKFLAILAKISHILNTPIRLASNSTRKFLDYWDAKSQPGQPLAPLHDLFSPSRMESVMMAWLPTAPSMAWLKTNIYAVDMFLTSMIAAGFASSSVVVYDGVRKLVEAKEEGVEGVDSVRVKVDFLRRGHWCSRVNQHHIALQWLVSTQSTAHKKGLFRMVPFDSEFQDRSGDNEDEGAKVDDFNMLPADEESYLDITHEGFTFRVWFDYAAQNNESSNKKDDDANPTEPPILVQRIRAGPTSIQWMKDWLRRVSIEFVKYQKSKKKRSRYQYDFESGDWQFVQALHSSKGLASVALDDIDEEALKTDLDTFLADREFYKRMGLPWKRGYMFTGRPGTGKTSLINAISAHYGRDIYFMNLKEFESDKQLQNAFSRVPKNALVVFEDVDAQSRCVWNRQLRRKLEKMDKMIGPQLPGAGDDDDMIVVSDNESASGSSSSSSSSSKKKSKKKKGKNSSKKDKKSKKEKEKAAKKERKNSIVPLVVVDPGTRNSSQVAEDLTKSTCSDDSAVGTDVAATPSVTKAAELTPDSVVKQVQESLAASADSMAVAPATSEVDEDEVDEDLSEDEDENGDKKEEPDDEEPIYDVNGNEVDAKTRQLMKALATSGAPGASGSTPPPPPPPPQDNGPTLATLLNCLDGHSLSEGIIIIMTSNHPEVLDPAVTRPGRIDLHLDLGYCTHSQLNKMYANVTEDDSARLDAAKLAEIPKNVIAPCEAMRIMILHRKRTERIIPELREAANRAIQTGVAVGGGHVARSTSWVNLADAAAAAGQPGTSSTPAAPASLAPMASSNSLSAPTLFI